MKTLLANGVTIRMNGQQNYSVNTLKMRYTSKAFY